VAGSSVDVLLARFHRYLLEERGLAATTADAYVNRARRFVVGWAPTGQLHDESTRDGRLVGYCTGVQGSENVTTCSGNSSTEDQGGGHDASA